MNKHKELYIKELYIKELEENIKELEEKLQKAVGLLDGAYDVVELWDVKSPSQIQWKKEWLEEARELGAEPAW